MVFKCHFSQQVTNLLIAVTRYRCTSGDFIILQLCFESVDDKIWPTEHWYTMRYALNVWTTKYGQRSIAIL